MTEQYAYGLVVAVAFNAACRKVEWLRGKYRTTSEAITKNAIIAIILLILRPFQRKVSCDSSLKTKSTTFVRNITKRLKSQIVILIIDINMTDIIVKTENGELVTNRDQLVVVDNIESLIKVIRGQQVMLDRNLATLYGVETKRLNEQVKRILNDFQKISCFN